MLEVLDDAPDADTAPRIARAAADHLRAIAASRGRGDTSLVMRAEEDVARDPRRSIRFSDDGHATVTADGQAYAGGRFELCRIGDLRGRTRGGEGRTRLWVLDGVSPATDIGALQATAPPRSMFQVASQFNCLEAPGPEVVPVAAYLHDPTQGPRASISAFPATLVRHYAAPRGDGSRFIQESDGDQINLLAGVCEPGVATVRNGYLDGRGVRDRGAFAAALLDRFDTIAVGVHDDAEVVLGADWDGGVDGASLIAQVFTSTVAGGMYGGPTSPSIVQPLLRAAYLGTLLAAAVLRKRRVVLTLIGGGVFGNPIREIWDAILWATDELAGRLHVDLSVIVNGRTLGRELPMAELREATHARSGGVVRFDPAGASLAI